MSALSTIRKRQSLHKRDDFGGPRAVVGLKRLLALLCSVASIGLWRSRPWSRWVVYLISMLLGLSFAWYLPALIASGWPYAGSLLVGLLLLMFGVAAPVFVTRVFRKSSVDA